MHKFVQISYTRIGIKFVSGQSPAPLRNFQTKVISCGADLKELIFNSALYRQKNGSYDRQ